MSKVKITQVRSRIGASQRQKDTLRSIGLKKVNHSIEKDTNPVLLGMLKKVNHLIRVEEL